MTEYFDQQGELANRTRVAGARGAAAIDLASLYEDSFPAEIVPFKEGWAVAPHQPQHPAPERRAAAIMPREDGSEAIFRLIPTPDIWAAGWSVQHWQPPAPQRRAGRVASAMMIGDDGDQLIFIPPWVMATPRSTFPNNQANPAAATPSYNAGPQVGAISSMPNITTPVLLKAAPGTLFAITVVAAGSQAGGFYDTNTLAAVGQATQVSPIPTTGGPLFLFEWPCQYGIAIVPGAGQVLAAKWC